MIESFRHREEEVVEQNNLLQKEQVVATIERMRSLLSHDNWDDETHVSIYLQAMRQGLRSVLCFVNEGVRIALPDDSVMTTMEFLGGQYERINKISQILEWPGTIEGSKLKLKLGDLFFRLQKQIEES